MTQPVVLLEQNDGVATLILNRPQVLNTLNEAMALALREYCSALAQDTRVRCVIIRGSGGNFMAGGDIGYFAQSLQIDATHREAGIRAIIEIVHQTITLLRNMPKPVIAELEGAVAGFGVSLMAACDLAIASHTARFTSAYGQIGLSPDGGNTFFLPRLMGDKRARAFIFLNETLDAEQALHLNLINQVCPPEQLTPTVTRMTQRILSLSPSALAQSKQLLNASSQNNLETHLSAEQTAFIACTHTNDFAEGIHAFLAKRPPQFESQE